MGSLKTSLVSLILLLGHFATAQCPGTSTCEGSEVLCSVNSLNGFTCNSSNTPNTSFPLSSLCFGTGTPNNLSWWSFVGAGGPLFLTFNYDIGGCNSGLGIQAGVFEGGCEGTRVWDCNANCTTTTFTLTSSTHSCEIYYLWVDGCNGDECTFTISVRGNSGPPTLPNPLPAIVIDPSVPCAGGSTSFCWPGLPNECDPSLEWFRDGRLIEEGTDCTQNLSFPDAQPSEICLRLTIGNPNVPESICDQGMTCLTVTPTVDLEIGRLRRICTRVDPFVWHGLPITKDCINPPCTVRTTSGTGCLVDSIVPFLIEPPELRIGTLKEIPPSKQPFFWHGVLISGSCINPPCSVRLAEANGCIIDSVRQFRLLQYPIDTGLIAGSVYKDYHNNCSSDPGEPILEGIKITLQGQSQSFQTLTDSSGHYGLLLPYDNYVINAEEVTTTLAGCPVNQSVSLDIQNQSHLVDFFIPDSNCYSGRLTLLPLTGRNRLRCDRRRRVISLEVTNIGRDTLGSDTAVLTIDSLMKFDRSVNAPYEVISPQEMWVTLPELLPGEKKVIRIFFESDCALSDESKMVCFKARYLNNYTCNGEALGSDFCSAILNSRDPNDLTITPYGVLSQRYIEKDSDLTGLIRFHNTGSDTAYDVVVNLDMSEGDFDLNSIQMLDASFSGTILRKNNGIVSFVLPDVKLPHNKIDSVNSHGYISYSIKTAADVSEWDEIDQQAHIFFDNNLPIATNIETQTIAGPYLYGMLEVSICEGDSFRNQVWLTDTVVTDTLLRLGPDSITSISIKVAPNYHISIDTQMLAGDLFGEFLIYRDTSVTINWRTQAGCDSTLTYHIDAVTTRIILLDKDVIVYPNPVDVAELMIHLKVPVEGSILLVNSRGRTCFEGFFSVNQSSVKLPSSMIEGMYFYTVQLSNGKHISGRLIIQ